MNLSMLDRSQLETLLLNPQNLECRTTHCAEPMPGAVAMYRPVRTARDVQVRHVLAVAHELLTRLAHEHILGRSLLETRSVATDYFKVLFAGCERESFAVIFVDSQHRVISAEVMFQGTLTQTSAYPREVVKRALELNAAAVLLGHSHPSGDPKPSFADEALTDCMKSALALVDVRLCDHIIVGACGTSSFAALGLL